jgi:hypothetical protein
MKSSPKPLLDTSETLAKTCYVPTTRDVRLSRTPYLQIWNFNWDLRTTLQGELRLC